MRADGNLSPNGNRPIVLLCSTGSVAGAEGIVWSSGFLVTGKTDGQVQLYDTTQDPPVGPYNIASSDTVYFTP